MIAPVPARYPPTMTVEETEADGTGRRRFLSAGVGVVAGGVLAAAPARAAGRRPALLSGTGRPRAAEGRPGDFYLDRRIDRLYGPKRRPRRRGRAWGEPLDLRRRRGRRGNGVLTSDGPPPRSLGRDGDFCIDVATTQIYGPKDDGNWGSPTNLTGPPGAVGPAGADLALAAAPETLIVGDIARDAAGAILAASVRWPDGTRGRYTGTASAAVPGAVESYEITYGEPTARTYRQGPVTRDASGAVVQRPPITVS